MKIIRITPDSVVPKYRQIINSIEQALAQELLKKNDKLPSINKVCMEFGVSRDTVLYAYETLKKKGVVNAILGRGYYIKSTDWHFEERIFLLFDELNAFKENLYNSLLEDIQQRSNIHVFFHYFNIDVFKKLIEENNGNYTKYIVMPSNMNDTAPIIKTLPKKDVYILDQTNLHLREYSSVHQNFAKDIYNGLFKAKNLLEAYRRLILIFPGKKEPIGMVEGFTSFCEQYKKKHIIISNFTDEEILKGDVFIIPDDKHLVNVIKQSKKQNLEIRKDFGIISYNETPLKSIVENGITTISTDFCQMGKILAEMVLNTRRERIENASDLIIRNSL
ncbi:GntR family transcriptional regulator [Chryseobacterium sp. NFX27]|uniref:GntR family transcriptional regulator n=1 Tax=Chryseobacterium sp. NFX27 TaxID=2819618 RepID=UPI003CF53731